MNDAAADDEAVAAFYARGLERDRLATGIGALEFLRTQSLLERYLPPPPAVVVDVGGGPGRYALWLAELGYTVHLVDPVPLHIEQARAAGGSLASITAGDARNLDFPDESADAVLMLGPLYHLTDRAARTGALGEARRVCRAGGVVMATAISRFASTLDGLRSGYLDDPTFAALAERDRRDGQHRNPSGDPAYFTTAYFHHPAELASEFAGAGLTHLATLAVEGPAWLFQDIDARLSGEKARQILLTTLASIESEPTMIGVSAHLLAVATRQ